MKVSRIPDSFKLGDKYLDKKDRKGMLFSGPAVLTRSDFPTQEIFINEARLENKNRVFTAVKATEEDVGTFLPIKGNVAVNDGEVRFTASFGEADIDVSIRPIIEEDWLKVGTRVKQRSVQDLVSYLFGRMDLPEDAQARSFVKQSERESAEVDKQNAFDADLKIKPKQVALFTDRNGEVVKVAILHPKKFSILGKPGNRFDEAAADRQRLDALSPQAAWDTLTSDASREKYSIEIKPLTKNIATRLSKIYDGWYSNDN